MGVSIIRGIYLSCRFYGKNKNLAEIVSVIELDARMQADILQENVQSFVRIDSDTKHKCILTETNCSINPVPKLDDVRM